VGREEDRENNRRRPKEGELTDDALPFSYEARSSPMSQELPPELSRSRTRSNTPQRLRSSSVVLSSTSFSFAPCLLLVPPLLSPSSARHRMIMKRSERYHLLLLQSLLLLPRLLLHLLNVVLELLLLLNRKSSHLLRNGVYTTQETNRQPRESAS